MSSAVLVQMNGLGFSFHALTHSRGLSISGRARIDSPIPLSMWATPETIYRFIHAPAQGPANCTSTSPEGTRNAGTIRAAGCTPLAP